MSLDGDKSEKKYRENETKTSWSGWLEQTEEKEKFAFVLAF